MPLSLLQMKQKRLNRNCNIGTFTVLRMENPKEAIVRLIPSQKARVQTRLGLDLNDDCEVTLEFIVEPDEHTELIWAAILSQNDNTLYISRDGIDWKRMILKIRLGCEMIRPRPPFWPGTELFEKIVRVDQLAALGEATQAKKTELTAEDIVGLSQNRYLLYAKVGHIYSRTPEESVYKSCENDKCYRKKVRYDLTTGLWRCRCGNESPTYQNTLKLKIELIDVLNPTGSITVAVFHKEAETLLGGRSADDLLKLEQTEYEEIVKDIKEKDGFVTRLRAQFYPENSGRLSFNVDHILM